MKLLETLAERREIERVMQEFKKLGVKFKLSKPTKPDTRTGFYKDWCLSNGSIELQIFWSNLKGVYRLYDPKAEVFYNDATDVVKKLELKEDAEAGPSAATILRRFAKELELKGFEAEVKNNSKPGIINRSKLCIKVKGYGIDDVFKLYKPFWGWEDRSTVYFVDAKHERKFSTIAEMVEKLKEHYKRLPKCLDYKPPLTEEADPAKLAYNRVLKFEQDLIDVVPIDSEITSVRKHVIAPLKNWAGAHLDKRPAVRYSFVVKYGTASVSSNESFLIVIDDLTYIFGVRPDKYEGRAPLAVNIYESKDGAMPFEKMVKLRCVAPSLNEYMLNRGMKNTWHADETVLKFCMNGRDILDAAVDWMSDE